MYCNIINALNEMAPYKTKDVDILCKRLIKEKVNVSDLKLHVLQEQQLHRIYFKVSLAYLKSYEEKFKFIEDNFSLLDDWWHVDQLTQFIGKKIPYDFIFNKAKLYVNNDLPYVRRLGYVILLSNYLKEENIPNIISLLKDDDFYHVQMAEAWLISYLGLFSEKQTLDFLNSTNLSYNIIGKSIQKICDSYRYTSSFKEQVKLCRKRYKTIK